MLIVILSIAFIIRVGWGLAQPLSRKSLEKLPDQVEYLSLGENLLQDQRLSFVDPRIQQEVRAFRMPGYPAFIALCGAELRVIRVVQAGLDASTVLAIYLLARRLFDLRTARLAAVLVAINPFLIYFSGLILSETLFVAMLAWGMVLLVQPKRSFLGAILLALSIYVRPSAIVLTVLLGWGAAVAMPSPRSLRWIGLRIVLLTAVLLFPWALRNRAVLGEWVFTTTNGGITFYDGFNPDADGSSNQHVFLDQMPRAHLARLGELGRDQHFKQLARRYMVANPWRCVELAAKKMLRTWSPLPLSDDFHKPLYIIGGLIYAIPLDALVIMAVLKPRATTSVKMFLLMPALYITVVHALSVGSLRYRIPAEGPMAVLAAVGAASLLPPPRFDHAHSIGQNQSAV